MRKKTLNYTLDKILWFIIYIFPLLGYLLSLFNLTEYATVLNSSATVFFNEVLGLFNLPFIETIFEWFNANMSDYLAFPVNSWICSYISYFFTMQFLHIILDIILFMFKWLQKILDKVGVIGD